MSRISLLVLILLGLLFVLIAAAQVMIPWEWWPFLLIVSGMAFLVALVLTAVRRVVSRP